MVNQQHFTLNPNRVKCDNVNKIIVRSILTLLTLAAESAAGACLESSKTSSGWSRVVLTCWFCSSLSAIGRK